MGGRRTRSDVGREVGLPGHQVRSVLSIVLGIAADV